MKAGAILLLVTVLAAHASADPDPRQHGGYIGKELQLLEIDDCPPLPPLPPERIRQIGAEHFSRGEVLYVQGDYPGAVNELVASYCLIPFYSILKDIGQAYERELEYGKAIAYFERFVMEVPKDAQRTSQCAADPQDDKKNVLARMVVLANLRAKIIVDTVPPNAEIVLENENGVQGRARSGQEISVLGGPYKMTIELAGFKQRTREIRADIGKPYTYFERLEPLLGHIRVRVTPSDARLFMNGQSVGSSDFDGTLPGQHYTFEAEAPGYVTTKQDIEVLTDRDNGIVSIALRPEREVGRRQLLGYATAAGGVAGALLAGGQDNPQVITGGLLAGVAAGYLGAYWGTAHDLALGTSSLTITGSLIGGGTGISLGLISTPNGNVRAPLVGGGLLLGAGVGYYFGDRLHVSPGDAAMINTGALWGTAAGALFYSAFSPGERVGGALVLSGLGMGTIGGALVTRYFTVSRGHAALIDVGGILGLFVGVAAENLFSQAATTGTQGQAERTANFALGGMATGLIAAGVLTRNMDLPPLAITPSVGKVTTGGSTTTTIGITGAF
ncbi:MAG: hypothetical protein JWO36_2393 [Myxococcales bacterium]|nr:hypothetical protein [Myxococcales bacterium]